MLNTLLKKYDKYLDCKKSLDGSTVIFRQSPFTTMKFDILTIENQYFGSSKWILKKIILMDSRRKDFFTNSMQHNKKLRQTQKDNRTSREIADFVLNGGMTFIT